MTIQRVLLTINVRWWNAEAAYAVNVARGLMDRGLIVWLAVNSGSPVHEKAVQLGIPVVTDITLDSLSPVVHWKNLKRLLSLIDRKNIQVVNSFKSNGSFLFSLARRWRRHILYVKTRGEARAPKTNLPNRYLYGSKACDGIIAVGNQVEQWIGELRIAGQNIRTIYYGDTPIPHDPTIGPACVRKELDISPEARVVALVGRTQRVKGHMISLKALDLLKDDSLHLLFLIKDLDEFPEELEELKEYCQLNHLQNRVSILGFQKNLGDIMSGVDVGIIPSLSSEVNCRVAVEFFSRGIPVVAFPTGSLPDIVQNRQNGYLCREKTEEELAKGIRWMLEDRVRLERTGRTALTHYRENYTLEKLASETLDFYDHCRYMNERS